MENLKGHLILQQANLEFIKGNLPKRQIKQIEVWADLYQKELMANWTLAKSGESLFKIEGLK